MTLKIRAILLFNLKFGYSIALINKQLHQICEHTISRSLTILFNFSGGKKVIIFTVCLIFFLSPAYAKKNKENSREIEPQVEKEISIKKILNDWVDVKIITPGLKFEEKTGNRWRFISRMTKKIIK